MAPAGGEADGPGPTRASTPLGAKKKGPEPGAAEATRRHKAPSEPRDGVEAEHSSPAGPERPARDRQGSRHTNTRQTQQQSDPSG